MSASNFLIIDEQLISLEQALKLAVVVYQQWLEPVFQINEQRIYNTTSGRGKG